LQSFGLTTFGALVESSCPAQAEHSARFGPSRHRPAPPPRGRAQSSWYTPEGWWTRAPSPRLVSAPSPPSAPEGRPALRPSRGAQPPAGAHGPTKISRGCRNQVGTGARAGGPGARGPGRAARAARGAARLRRHNRGACPLSGLAGRPAVGRPQELRRSTRRGSRGGGSEGGAWGRMPHAWQNAPVGGAECPEGHVTTPVRPARLLAPGLSVALAAGRLDVGRAPPRDRERRGRGRDHASAWRASPCAWIFAGSEARVTGVPALAPGCWSRAAGSIGSRARAREFSVSLEIAAPSATV